MTESHWTRHAAQWNNVGSPLRPNEEDQRQYWQAIAACMSPAELAQSRTLLLGVTPELRALPWPSSAQLIACDLSLQMLHGIWPMASYSGDHATRINSDWMRLPLAANCCTLALGDGCLTTVPGDQDYRRIARELHHVLAPDAHLIVRLFCAPENAEQTEDVLADLRRGAVGNFHAYKWRLVMAMHAHDPALTLADVWASWDAEFPDKQAVARLSGWSIDAINTLSAYRDAPARYSYLSVAQVAELFAPEFKLIGMIYPSYELGERCPIVSFQRIRI